MENPSPGRSAIEPPSSWQESSTPLDEGQVAASSKEDEVGTLPAPWFPFWQRPTKTADQPVDSTATASATAAAPPEIPHEAAAPASEADSSGSIWAFWFRDSGRPSTAEARAFQERGQLAVIRELSGAHTGTCTNGLAAKEAGAGATAAERDGLAVANSGGESSKKKRLRPQSSTQLREPFLPSGIILENEDKCLLVPPPSRTFPVKSKS